MSDGYLVARVEITRTLHDDGADLVGYEATDGSGGELAIVEILGLLELAKDTAIRGAMGQGDGR